MSTADTRVFKAYRVRRRKVAGINESLCRLNWFVPTVWEEMRRLWRRGRSNIAVAIVRGHRKSYCVGFPCFEQGLGNKLKEQVIDLLFVFLSKFA